MHSQMEYIYILQRFGYGINLNTCMLLGNYNYLDIHGRLIIYRYKVIKIGFIKMGVPVDKNIMQIK